MRMFFLIFTLLLSTELFAWGGRGHDTICQATSFLVSQEELKKFLQGRAHVLGHLCNIPDIYWRDQDPNLTREVNPSHFIDPKILGLQANEIGLDFTELIKKSQINASTQEPIKFLPHELGSVWWRAEQFYKLATQQKAKMQSEPPKDRKQEQDAKLSFNEGVYQWMVYLGVMGHFVGDTSQPHHSTLDYDGWKAGHGGIHSYYEDFILSQLDAKLLSEVVLQAQKMIRQKPAFLNPRKSFLERMRTLSQASVEEIPLIYKADKLLENSVDAKERDKRQLAKRVSHYKTIKNFKPLIIKQLARAAALQAQLMDEAYLAVGSPKLSMYKSYRYPFQPPFVMPDYYPIPE